MNEIIHGDNCDVLAGFEKGSVDLVVTSPPYDDLRQYGGHEWDFYGVSWLLSRVIKDGGVIVWVVSDATVKGSETGTSLIQSQHFLKLGLFLHDTMIYRTNKPPSAKNRYQPCWEYMFVFSKGPPSHSELQTEPCIWAGVGTSPTQRSADGKLVYANDGSRAKRRVIKETKPRENIWHYETGSGKSTSTHPATFPVSLAKDHIVTWSAPGDLVLDPFCGSGTTCRAAADTGRRWVGIEVNGDYVKLANARMEQKTLELNHD